MNITTPPDIGYYHVRRLTSGMYAVAHRVPGTNAHHIDLESMTLRGAQLACADLEATRRNQYAPQATQQPAQQPAAQHQMELQAP
jgi:hypothetical protein